MKVGKNIIEVEIGMLVQSPLNPRRDFGNITELGDTIAQNGIIEPLIVVKRNDKYEVIVGERRRQAAQLLKLATLPCRVAELSDFECLRLMAVEEFQRKELQPTERLSLYNNLKQKMTEKEIAALLGTSLNQVKKILRLNQLDDSILPLVRNRTDELESSDRVITSGKCNEMASLPKEVQKALAKKIMEKGLTEKEIRKQADNFGNVMANVSAKTEGYEEITMEKVMENIDEVLEKGHDFFNVPEEKESPVMLRLHLRSVSDVGKLLVGLEKLGLLDECEARVLIE
jgi:ParB/RepB/Spo0J family partition protein